MDALLVIGVIPTLQTAKISETGKMEEEMEQQLLYLSQSEVESVGLPLAVNGSQIRP
jgi:hypothetical protein